MPRYATYPSLVDRTAVITGGATGIGAAFVTAFAQQGAKVAFLDVDDSSAAELVHTLRNARHRPVFLHCDVADLAALAESIHVAHERIGPIAVLVNNVANDVRHKLETTTPAEFDGSMAVNLRHQYFATQAVVEDMRRLGGGSVVCLGSTGWMIKNADYPLYATAKAAIHGLVNGLARTLGRDHIRINCLVPGWVMTEKQQRLWLDAEGEAEIRRRQCLPGHLEPDDLARAALFLAADDSRMCTGQSFIVDGGWV
ncbi:MAG: SDR family oxidoreductase [Rhodanobacteraceae bacterium]|nr:MAG: SDR family oxidoreductase [Rhodanobacteraceae bacterium]